VLEAERPEAVGAGTNVSKTVEQSGIRKQLELLKLKKRGKLCRARMRGGHGAD